ncbi:Transglycosylase SLT domain-containing protein [Thermanaeromonas toyohensis ToBE]|uniref:Transglycosylase SLT domain-containing protein n=2 Tax=Thermanaeromonas TaxID=202949 RepID=A0A1W1VQM4_9FIRM|nr:Transglycosylase SLT domain-containing protein [Thermanaeromonas toyohensis ToBE]
MEIESLWTASSTWMEFPVRQRASKGCSRLLFNLLFLRVLARLISSQGKGQSVSLLPEGNPSLSPFHSKRGASTSSMRTEVPGELRKLLEEVARQYQLPLNLLQGVVKAESNFNPQAVSPSGALGLMQLMPETARALGVKNPFDPRENLEAGARYLRQMLDLFQGNIDLALAAYNAGPGTVQRYGGIPPYRETQEYIKKVKGIAQGFETWS